VFVCQTRLNLSCEVDECKPLAEGGWGGGEGGVVVPALRAAEAGGQRRRPRAGLPHAHALKPHRRTAAAAVDPWTVAG
jgi:hypothetical protein